MGEGGDFIAHERQVAMNVRDALLQTPVKQVIFLSSLQAPANEQSDHLRARQLTAETLRSAGIPVTELRAGIIVGAGSAAFEVMRDMVYNLPVLTPALGAFAYHAHCAGKPAALSGGAAGSPG
jgi:uncharacterized protein YbjT (DUF2867 family)